MCMSRALNPNPSTRPPMTQEATAARNPTSENPETVITAPITRLRRMNQSGRVVRPPCAIRTAPLSRGRTRRTGASSTPPGSVGSGLTAVSRSGLLSVGPVPARALDVARTLHPPDASQQPTTDLAEVIEAAVPGTRPADRVGVPAATRTRERRRSPTTRSIPPPGSAQSGPPGGSHQRLHDLSSEQGNREQPRRRATDGQRSPRRAHHQRAAGHHRPEPSAGHVPQPLLILTHRCETRLVGGANGPPGSTSSLNTFMNRVRRRLSIHHFALVMACKAVPTAPLRPNRLSTTSRQTSA